MRVSLFAWARLSRRPSNLCSPIMARRKHSMAALWAAMSCAAIMPSSSSFGRMPISAPRAALICFSCISGVECFSQIASAVWRVMMSFQSSELEPPICLSVPFRSSGSLGDRRGWLGLVRSLRHGRISALARPEPGRPERRPVFLHSMARSQVL